MLSIDIETYSDVDIRKAGVYAYVDSAAFEILLFGYKYKDQDIEVIDLTREELPQWIIDALNNPTITKTAFNANFERVCLSKYLGIKLPIDQWCCTAVLASVAGLPHHLKDVAQALKLDVQKDANGTRLINYFSVPCKPSKANGNRSRNLPDHAPDKWEEFKVYCGQDVKVETAIRNRLRPIPESEQRLYVLDQMINDRGVKVDTNFIASAIALDKIHTEKCMDDFSNLTGGVNARSNKQFLEYLKEKGVDITSTDKATIVDLLENTEDDKLKRVLKLKTELSKTSVKKYEAMQRCVCTDGRVHGLLQFYGAGRTGRWAGRLVQIHNLPQNHIENLELTRETISKCDYDTVKIFCNDIPTTLSQLIRTSFTPSKGRKFIVCDFSAIEARIIAYLAGETWRIEVFNTHGKIYEASASQMFKVPLEEITKTSPLRQKGKIAELALGYGGGVGALKQMGAEKMGLNDEELSGLVHSWRAANPQITKFWRTVEKASIKAVKGEASAIDKGISFARDKDTLYIKLPSGRKLAYVNPSIITNRFGAEAIKYNGVGMTKAWEEIETYGGKLVENIVQAVARDCLAESLTNLHINGYDIVFHVHDEIVIEAGKDTKVEDIEKIMGKEIEWAKGLYLTAAGFESKFYRKD